MARHKERRLGQAGSVAVLLISIVAGTGADATRARPADRAATPGDYVCGPLLSGAANFVRTMLDPSTGLPYDHLRCNCRWVSERGVCQSSGVLPQLPDGDIIPFTEAPSGTLGWQFVDDLATGADPTLLYALELRPQLTPANRFGGLIWGAGADVSRYDRVWIRYRTATPTSTFELKLNSGLEGDTREVTVELPGSPAGGSWTERTLRIDDDFPGTDAAHLNYLVLATSLALAGESEPVLWVDHLAFLADPARAAECTVVLECGDPSCYPDLVRFEPQTGAVNVANAVTGLTLLAEVGLLDPADAKARVQAILASLSATPRLDGWMQDWHSPASLMPHPTNRIASLTDLPQLYAALMVVETTWLELAPAAAALRGGMVDFTDLFDAVPAGACPGELHWATDVCAGRQEGLLEYYGNDALLGEVLAIASGAVPPAFWSECLSRKGCELRGEAGSPWYTTGAFACADHDIPAVETGGPFLQLAPLLYLTAQRLPLGTPSLAASAANMLLAQSAWAADLGLAVWGWANHSDSDSCAYLTCELFAADRATPYICAMGLDLQPTTGDHRCADNLFAFDQLGAGAPLDTGTVLHEFGLRDAWNQATGSAREDGYLYLDTGWMALGLLNACHQELVRQRFAAHPEAAAVYAALARLPTPCPPVFSDGFESGDLAAWSAAVGQAR